jgi:hypothetical protein
MRAIGWWAAGSSAALRAEWERFDVDQESPIAVDDARDQLWLSALFRF